MVARAGRVALLATVTAAMLCCRSNRVEGSVVLGVPEVTFTASTKPVRPLESHDLDLLSRVVCAECKGCASQERIAIAHVALNRAARPSWWGNGLADVLTKPSQFATAHSPRCRRELHERSDGKPWSAGWSERHRDIMAQIRFESLMALEGERPDPTGGAVYFHARRLGDVWRHLSEVRVPPSWQHRFFREDG